MRIPVVVRVGIAMMSAACAMPARIPTAPVVVPGSDTVAVPLTEMASRTYKGLSLGLFPGGSNREAAAYENLGFAHRNAIVPLDVNGRPSATGRYVLMSAGGADASAAWCSASSAPPCSSSSFTGRATSDASLNHGALVIVNAAIPGVAADGWTSSASANYNRIRDTRLAPLGLSEKQVQAVWMYVGDVDSVLPGAASRANAGRALQRIDATIRALKQRYPNLQLLFLTSHAYAGFAINGEPGAYETGFAVRWVIDSQMRASPPYAGNVSPVGTWISWGPYIWTAGPAIGASPMPSARSDFDASGAGLSREGAAKVGALLLDFFKTSEYTQCWFVTGAGCR